MPHLKHKAWLMATAVIALLYCLVEAGGKGDFYIFTSAAGNLLQHRNIYEQHYSDSYNYFYSVLFALLLEPFYFLPYFWVKLGWLLLNMGLYAHLFGLMASAPPVKALPQKQQTLFLLLVFIFSLRFLHDNIHTSQITILILWCCVYGLYLICHQKPVAGSALLALGINIKLLPVVFLPYLLYRGYYKAFALTVLFLALAFFGPALVIGYEYNLTLLKSWTQLVNPMQQRHVLDVEERSFHGLSTLMATLLVKNVPDVYALPIRRNIADVSLQTLFAVLLAVRLFLIAFSLYFLRWKPFVKAKSAFNRFIELSYLLLLIPLIFPHQQHYAFLFMVPAFALCLYYLLFYFKGLSKRQRIVLISFLALIYLAANLKILLGEFNQYYEHFKILTYGALLLIPLLAWVLRQGEKKALLVPEN